MKKQMVKKCLFFQPIQSIYSINSSSLDSVDISVQRFLIASIESLLLNVFDCPTPL